MISSEQTTLVWVELITTLGTLGTLIVTKVFEILRDRRRRNYELQRDEHQNKQSKTMINAIHANTDLTAKVAASQVVATGRTLEDTIQENGEIYEALVSAYRKSLDDGDFGTANQPLRPGHAVQTSDQAGSQPAS